jgi:hopanoid C-3 methylase
MSARLRVLAYKPRPEPQTIRMERLITCEPLELEYLATVLADHDVVALDGMVDGSSPLRAVRRLRAEVVLITAFITNVDRVMRLAADLRSRPAPPRVFVGGPHAEVVPEHFFTPGIDGVFFADQLNAISTVMDRIAAGECYDDVPGGAFPGEDGTFARNHAPPLDPATLPVPRRVLFDADPDRYFYLYYRRCASLKTAFGCTERCNFCFCTRMHGGDYGPRPMGQVLDEIEGISERNVFILDDNFLTSVTRLRDFCDGLDERGLADAHEYIVYGSASFIAHHSELLPRLRAVGVTGLIVGFESISDDELETMRKSGRQADNDRTVALCRDNDIELFALFIVRPDWDADRFRALARYVREQGIVFATFATATVFPGTDLDPAPPPSGPGAGGWWRYDLLRLHQDPAHMGRLRFYLWLLYLYMVPSFTAGGRRTMLRRYGLWGLLGASFKSWLVGIEYLVKLWIWR